MILTASEYAAACGVTVTVINKRIRLGYIQAQKISGGWKIDADKFPPVKVVRSAGRPKNAEKSFI